MMNSKILRLLFVILALLPAGFLWGEGLPVTSEVVRDNCGTCHQADAQQRLSRISYARKTPEGWEETVRRMVRIHGVKLSPTEAREIVQYLSDHQGLTASELDKISYALEQRDEPEQIPNEAAKAACATCHSYAKVAAQRRTKEEWFKLKDFLMAMFPTMVYQHRRIDWSATADQALAYFAEQFPLESPEWQKEKDQPAPGDSTWVIVGSQRGKGEYVGLVTTKNQPDGSRQVQTAITFADGTKNTGSGNGRWYAGYSWRGSNQWQDGKKAREVFHLSADGKTVKGRWFIFDHPEIGGDEIRYRVDGQPRIVAVFPKAVKRGAKSVQLNIYGANLPANIQPVLGDGVKVEKISESAADHVTVEASVLPDAKIGHRDVTAGNVVGKDLLAIYDAVDYVRVFPDEAMARIGGERLPKRFTQFEAHAFSNGADGKAGTPDDLDIGLVKATWQLSEESATPDDTDVKYVGNVDQNGLFTPAGEGPNPARFRSTNNAGDAWVEAKYTPESANAKPLTGRAFLLVSVPLYRQNLIP